MVKTIILSLMLSATAAYASMNSLQDELDALNVNYVVRGTVIYLLDETSPTDICELADGHPSFGITEVINAKTLVSADCSMPKYGNE